jgi:hypothetical protein
MPKPYQPNVSGAAAIEDFDERLGMGIMYDDDSGLFYLVDGEGEQVGGPYTDKLAAQEALQRRAHYYIGKRRKGAGPKMKRQRAANPAWEQLEKLVDEDVGDGANPETRAGSMSKILKTAHGKELYAKGAGYVSRREDDEDEDEEDEKDDEKDEKDENEDDVEKRWVVRKADAVWERIKRQAESIQKRDLRGRVSFAKAVDEVLRDDPELYTEYRRALMQR